VEIGRTSAPDGTVANSRVKIGTATFMVSEASEKMQPTKSTYYLFVEDADLSFKKSVTNGAKKIFEPMNMPYGDRQSRVIDPAGNIWWVSKRLVQEPYDQ
jgi:PhnB protein